MLRTSIENELNEIVSTQPELILNDGGEIQRQPSNSFIIEFQKVVSLSEKTAFMVHDENTQDFDNYFRLKSVTESLTE